MMRTFWLAFAVALLVVSAHAGAPGKLPTDEAIRTEMKAIRDLTLNVHTLVTHRRMPPADARTFHTRVKAAVERLKAGTQVQAETRGEIEKLASYIERGAAAVAGADSSMSPIDGILIIDDSLAIYAQRFDHPDWQPLR
ncbi:hypothetical protein [Hyphomicrobium sp.]|uniref:hypothetical protein n=1 Tax=Hyphomicrobium sp. TaxID=82 RepID=UPI0025BB420A|nr:hypothetical protein [Hyphomicrobium sp.]MCC7251731.1 hypothetical protein [Hyphomicrobium sp.]